MSAQLAAYGRLGADPVQRTSQAGKPWATSLIAVDLGNGDDHDTPATWFGLVAFGKVAEQLCRCSKGDLVSVAGRLQLNRWRDNDGKEHERMQVVAEAVISAKTVRSGGGRRSNGGADDTRHDRHNRHDSDRRDWGRA